MIDDDFQPNRLQFRALGYLLLTAQNFPFRPFTREHVLYEQVFGEYVGGERRDWLAELEQHGLIKFAAGHFSVNDPIGSMPFDVCLTPAGAYYSASRAHLFGENARTPTDDFPDEIVDAPWAIHAYYSPHEGGEAPTADSIVPFDHNRGAFENALSALDAVSDALRADNEIGANYPEIRDDKLLELQAIRQILEKGQGWTTKLIAAGWGALGYLMTQFADRPVGYLANQAWHALQAVIGLR